MYATWMERLSPRLVFVKDLVLAIAEISLYNVHMNKQEQLAIDRATADARGGFVATALRLSGFAHASVLDLDAARRRLGDDPQTVTIVSL